MKDTTDLRVGALARGFVALLATFALCSSRVSAEGVPGATAMRTDPCAGVRASAPDPAGLRVILHPGAIFRLAPQTSAERESGRRAAARQRQRDWADVCRYRASNAALKRRPLAVFMGDSITELWGEGDPSLFGARVLDRGISGQTSAQMLVRFWPDVIALRPRIVQILAGTNDIAGNTGPTSEQDYEDNIRAMVDLAQMHRIRVMIGAIPPSERFWWAPRYRPAAEIRRLNAWLRRYARRRGVRFVDYYTPLATPSGAFRRDLSNDGVHPNAAGFKVMSALAKRALATPWPRRAHAALTR